MNKIIVLILTILIFSCNSDSNDVKEEEDETFYRLTKTIEKDKDGNIEETVNYEFNKKGQLIKYISIDKGVTYISEITYSDDKPISVSRSHANTITYTYNDDLIIGMSVIEDNILFTHEYSYNASSELILDKQYNDDVFCCEESYEYINGNRLKSVSNQGGISNYEYDNKKNPKTAYIPVQLIRIDDYPSKNNIININSEKRFDYEYNNEGFPTKLNGYFNGNVFYTIEYTYEEI
ncbi:hypothetical protein [uncultured Wocania sp.]|uniref:hypothetical protein n=1 Tax=uncultured Wocania sp. TaxID=2834404 RepID=UPI0030F4C71C